MREVNIRALHEKTGQWVRAGSEEAVVITDRGRPVAILAPLASGATARPLPDREAILQAMPRLAVTSEVVVSRDRERE